MVGKLEGKGGSSSSSSSSNNSSSNDSSSDNSSNDQWKILKVSPFGPPYQFGTTKN